MNLAKSEKMIRKAIENDRKQRQKDNPDQKPEEIKDNPSYLDSLGWVLYKQKKYKEAKARTCRPRSPRRKGRAARSTITWPIVCWPTGDEDRSHRQLQEGRRNLRHQPASDQKRKADIEKKLKQALAD